MSWDFVKGVHLLGLDHRAESRMKKIREIKTLDTNEIAVGKYHRYLTTVLNLESGEAVWVGQGQGKDALHPFYVYAFLRDHRLTPAGVAVDMSAPYIERTLNVFPDTDIVQDRYHILPLTNRTLDDI